MSQAAPAITRPPSEVVRRTPVSQAPNGICYAISGETTVSENEIARMVSAWTSSGAVSAAVIVSSHSANDRKSGRASSGSTHLPVASTRARGSS